MIQKVIKVGTSLAVVMPRNILEEAGLGVGDKIDTSFNKANRVISVKPIKEVSKEDQKIAKLTLGFISRYRKDLEFLKDK